MNDPQIILALLDRALARHPNDDERALFLANRFRAYLERQQPSGGNTRSDILNALIHFEGRATLAAISDAIGEKTTTTSSLLTRMVKAGQVTVTGERGSLVYRRAGQLSVREIGKRYGVSHVAIEKKAKRNGWARDLSGKVKQEVNRRLVTSEVTSPKANHREAIEAASARAVDVVMSHRKDIQRLHTLKAQIIDRAEAQQRGLAPAQASFVVCQWDRPEKRKRFTPDARAR
ncbi:hypothetical protein WCLP8_2870010 [uncultured Gammaproteobacteria bacterium]